MKRLFDFKDSSFTEDWRAINDALSGTGSECKVEMSPRGSCLFEGNVSVDGAQGFAILRTENRTWDLRGAEGLFVRFRGDGKTYTIGLKDNDDFGGMEYRAHFKTADGARTDLKVLLSDLEAVEYDQIVEDPRPINLSNITQVSFMVLNQQEGGFRIDIEELAAYQEVGERVSAANGNS
jgi:hypothetical protein